MFNFIYVLVTTFIFQSDAARILAIFPSASISHQIVFRPITQELAKRGHEVVVITTDPAFPKGEAPKNLQEIDLHDLAYSVFKDLPLISTGKKRDLLNILTIVYQKMPDAIKDQLQFDEIQKLIKDKNSTFDLLLIELFTRPALGFSHVYDVPVVFISSIVGMPGTFEMIGTPTNPNLYPVPFRQRTYNLSCWDNIMELYTYYSVDRMIKNVENEEHEMLKTVIDSNIVSIEELKKNVQLFLLYSHHLWDFNRPVPKSVQYLSRIHLNPEKDLPKDLKVYLDSAKDGVVYVSLGTNAQTHLQPPELIKIFLKAFSTLSYNVLLRWHKDIPNCPKNVKVAPSFPQFDVLKHSNIKAFVTQGGPQSTDESIDAGVPLVGIPLLSDQWYMTEKYEIYNIGIKLDMETLTADVLRNAIEEVISDGRYRKNILKLRSKIIDEPYTALQRSVWWIEYLLRHGGLHLRAPAAQMHWAEYYELNLVIAVLLIFIIISIIVAYLIRKIFNIALSLMLFKRKFE